MGTFGRIEIGHLLLQLKSDWMANYMFCAKEPKGTVWSAHGGAKKDKGTKPTNFAILVPGSLGCIWVIVLTIKFQNINQLPIFYMNK